jgi:copper chaperone CopZ
MPSNERRTDDRAPAATTRTILRSDELTCPSCVAKIERALNRTGGVSHATVHFATGRIEVEHDPTRADADALVEAVRAAGYRASRAPF